MNSIKTVNHQVVFWTALVLLLILRIPLFSWVVYWIPSTAAWIHPLFEIGTYTLIVFLIWWERENLQIHHMDALAIIIIILFKPLSTIILFFWVPNDPIAFPNLLSFSFSIVAFILIVLILRKKIVLRMEIRRTIFWFIVGGFLGIALFIVEGIIMIKYLNIPTPINPGNTAWIYPIYQLGYAAVPEEPFFRGFLWGGLKKAGVKDLWILLIQAALFTSSHIHLITRSQPILLFGCIFIDAIIMGVLVWRSRLLSSTLSFHGFANGSAIAQYWVYSFLFR